MGVLMANIWRPPQNWTFHAKILWKGFLFFLSFLSFTTTPLSVPHIPLPAPIAWALALNSDPACNQSYPWALPSSQATDSSLLRLPPRPTSPSCSPSLSPCFLFFLSFLFLDPEWPCWLLMAEEGVGGSVWRQRRVNRASAAEQQTPAPLSATPLALGPIHQSGKWPWTDD